MKKTLALPAAVLALCLGVSACDDEAEMDTENGEVEVETDDAED